MDDEEDLKKMIEVLNNSKQKIIEDFHFDEFIDSEESDFENNLNDNEPSEVDELLTNIETFDVFNIYKHDPISSLKPEEKDLIDGCEDSELKRLLFLNRRKNINLILLYKKLQDLLMECRQYIIEKVSLLKEHINTLKSNNLSGGAWRLAAPYFKDKQLYQAPQNEDTKRKIKNNELSIYDLGFVAKWSSFECEKILKAVKLNYTFNKQQFMKAELKANKQLASLKLNEQSYESDQLEIPPLNSNDHIDWGRIASVFIQDKHTEKECQSIWHLYLHPSINKSSWTTKESDKLKTIAMKYKLQNWKNITLELGTNRSELIVCKHYFSSLSEKYKKGEFTYEEDKKLLQTVNMYKIGNYIQWNKITRHFDNRTRGQLHHRYTYYLSQDSKKRGTFTKAEDIILMIYVDKFGRKFKNCVEFLPERSMIQCKARFTNNLERTVQKGKWTLEEDEKIMAYVKEHGPQRWTVLAKRMARSRGQLRQRYLRIKHFLEKRSTANLSDVPRREKSLSESEGSYAICRSIADRYRNTTLIPSISEIEKILKSCMSNMKYGSSSDDDFNEEEKEDDRALVNDTTENVGQTKQMDDLLMDFFSNSYNIPKINALDPLEYVKGVDDIERILKGLKADLCIPDNFDNIEGLDPLDIRILDSLSSRQISDFRNSNAIQKFNSIQELVPPNFHSTVGLRSLLIKHLHFSHRKREISEFASNTKNPFSQLRQIVTTNILNFNKNDRKEIESERNLFYRRFHSIFKWPAVMTLEKPSAELLNISEFLPQKKVTQVKRTYSRLNCNEENKTAKKLKISNQTTEPPNVIKLTPVSNKSIIQDLIRNKKKKLFSLDKITENGQIKTVINEIKLDFAVQNIAASSSATLGNATASKTTDMPPIEEEEEQVCVDTDSHKSVTKHPVSLDDFGHRDNICTSGPENLLEVHNEEQPTSVDEKDTIMLDRDNSNSSISLTKIQDNNAVEDGYQDMYDLEKLNVFLKSEIDIQSDSDSDISNT